MAKCVRKAIVKEMRRQGRIQRGMPGMMCSMEINEINDVQVYDDMSGKMLDPREVEQARKEEMKEVRNHKVYVKVPIQQCFEETGQAPIGTRWVDVNKGDDKNIE